MALFDKQLLIGYVAITGALREVSNGARGVENEGRGTP